MSDDFYNIIEKIKKEEKKIKIDITKRNELESKNNSTSLVKLNNKGRCSYPRSI